MNLDRFNQFVSEGRIIRNAWNGADAQGRETACLLAAFAEGVDDSSKCPAEIMPAWLAELTPAIDDNGSLAAWPAMVQRYAACANRWSALDKAAWRRVLLRFLDAALVISEPYDSSRVVALVRVLIARELGGDAPRDEEWREAETAAWAAAAAAAASWATRAEAAEAAEAAAAEAAWATRAEAAWDTMTDALLGAIEREIEKAAK